MQGPLYWYFSHCPIVLVSPHTSAFVVCRTLFTMIQHCTSLISVDHCVTSYFSVKFICNKCDFTPFYHSNLPPQQSRPLHYFPYVAHRYSRTLYHRDVCVCSAGAYCSICQIPSGDFSTVTVNWNILNAWLFTAALNLYMYQCFNRHKVPNITILFVTLVFDFPSGIELK